MDIEVKKLLREKMFLTVPEFNRITGNSRSLTYKLIKSGAIPASRFGSAIRIPVSYLAGLDENFQR
jgi:excisionase family DNA binding protein